MGFHSQKYRKERQEKSWDIHPIWRGIGCALILIIPIMAWFTAELILESNNQLPLPPELTKPLTLRYIHIEELDQIIADFNRFTISNNLIAGQFLLTVFLIFIGFGILSMIYAFMFRAVGPSRYGPFDIPPDVMKK
jgi:hypothetical protein